VVGIRALTMQFTSGNSGRSFGCLDPHPPFTFVLSTSVDFGTWFWEFEGVWESGEDGGVKAGETRSGRCSAVCEAVSE